MNKIPRKQLAVAITKMTQDSDSINNLPEKVAAYLIAEMRTKELDSLIRDIMRLRFETLGILELDTASAHPLTNEAKSLVAELLPAKQHILNENILPKLAGGIRVQTTDHQLDLTVINRLNGLKNKLSPA